MQGKETIDGYRPNPLRPLKHRADCTDFYCEPEDDDFIAFRGPNEVVHAIEAASERAGRTFNAQLLYVIELCRGNCTLLPGDERTEEEWRLLLRQLDLRFNKGEEWIPLAPVVDAPSPPCIIGSARHDSR